MPRATRSGRACRGRRAARASSRRRTRPASGRSICGCTTHVDPLGRDVEEPARLDHLEALVHQRRRVDRDLRAHLPVRVGQRLRRAVALAMRSARPGRGTGRPRRSGSGARSSRRWPARHWKIALCSESIGRSFAPLRARLAQDERARHHHHFLVGERDVAAAARIAASTGSRPDRADERADRRDRRRAVATSHSPAAPDDDRGVGPPSAARTIAASSARIDRDELRPELLHLLGSAARPRGPRRARRPRSAPGSAAITSSVCSPIAAGAAEQRDALHDPGSRACALVQPEAALALLVVRERLDQIALAEIGPQHVGDVQARCRRSARAGSSRRAARRRSGSADRDRAGRARRGSGERLLVDRARDRACPARRRARSRARRRRSRCAPP